LLNVIKREAAVNVRGLKSYLIEDLAIAMRSMNEPTGGDNAAAKLKAAEAAKVSARELEARAYESGFNAGLSEGENRAAVVYSRAVELLAKMADELKAARESFINKTEEDMVVLSLEIARQIIRQEVKTNSEIIKSVAKEAIAQLIDKEGVTIRVNSQDCDVMKASDSGLGILLEGKDRYKILADDFVSPGGCIIESKTGIVDADLETQFDEIWKKMLNTGE